MSPLEFPCAPLEEGSADVEIDVNGAGQTIYRHVFYTEWQVVPLP